MTQGYYPRFSTAEYQRRYDLVRALMKEHSLDAVLIGGGGGSADIAYLTNYLPWSPAWVLLPADGKPVLFHHFFNHNPCTREMSIVEDVRWYGPSAPPTLAQSLKELDLGTARVGVVGLAGAISYNQFEALRKAAPEVTFQDIGRPWSQVRLVRSAEEIEWFRKSAHLTDLCCEHLEQGLRPGMTEHDVSLLLHQAFIPHGGKLILQFMSSTPMDAPERFVPWQYPTSRVLQKGDALITELSVSYWGYTSQIHRPFALCQPPTPVYQELFDVALECYERIFKLLRPGVTSEEIIAASEVIEERGFTTYDSLFHGDFGKGPELGTRSAVHPPEPFTCKENMVLVIQPNPVTRSLGAGLQLGAGVVITADGAECLHRYPLQFPVCG